MTVLQKMGSLTGMTVLAGAGGTGLGGLLACIPGGDARRRCSFLLSCAAGVMLAVVCFDLLPDALAGSGGVPAVAAGVLAGCAAVMTLSVREVSETAGGPERAEVLDRRLRTAGRVTAVAIALHNLPEGMIIGASLAAGDRGGVWMALLIGLHNIPEGMAVSAPLVSGGAGRLSSVWTAALAGLATLPGAVLGYCLGSLHPAARALSLRFASGAMLQVVFGELLPESARLWQSAVPALGAVLGLLTGLLLPGG